MNYPLIHVASKVSKLLGEQDTLPIRLHGGLGQLHFSLSQAALLCVDMQEHLARPGSGPKAEAATILHLEKELEYYWTRIELTIGNLRRLQAAFRGAGLEVIHQKGGSLTPDGRDSGRMKSLLRAGRSPYAGDSGIVLSTAVPRDSPLISELAALENEMVFVKNGATAFGLTRIDMALRNVGVEILVVGGAITNQCVEATVRGAFDHGFGVVLVDDACAAYSEELHKATLRSIGDMFCKVLRTDDVLQWFRH